MFTWYSLVWIVVRWGPSELKWGAVWCSEVLWGTVKLLIVCGIGLLIKSCSWEKVCMIKQRYKRDIRRVYNKMVWGYENDTRGKIIRLEIDEKILMMSLMQRRNRKQSWKWHEVQHNIDFYMNTMQHLSTPFHNLLKRISTGTLLITQQHRLLHKQFCTPVIFWIRKNVLSSNENLSVMAVECWLAKSEVKSKQVKKFMKLNWFWFVWVTGDLNLLSRITSFNIKNKHYKADKRFCEMELWVILCREIYCSVCV